MIFGRGALGEQLLAIWRFSSRGTAEPSHMCDWKSGFSPRATRSAEMSSSGADEAVELVLGAVVGVQRDVDRVVLRTSAAYAAKATGAG
jgi:hypothetical protein